MKDQYVADVNDYFKYAFLRSVRSHTDVPLVVCWMATEDDGGSDGRRRKYLEQPDRYGEIDPALFEQLTLLVRDRQPSITTVESAPILPGASFFSRCLTDPAGDRDEYFTRLWKEVPPRATIFFDPDNGLEVKSVPRGRKGSSKFLYLHELATAGSQNRSVIVYQHFGRVERTAYLHRQLERVGESLPEHDHFALAGTHIAFLVAAEKTASRSLRTAAADLCGRWTGIRIVGRDRRIVRPGA